MFDILPLKSEREINNKWEEPVRPISRPLIHRQMAWALFFGSILVAWGALFAMQADPDFSAPVWSEPGLRALAAMCRTTAGDAGYGPAVAMWSLMSLAMMAPTAFPALKTYADLPLTGGAHALGTTALFAGYLLIWIGFSALAGGAQVQLARLGVLDPEGRSLLPVLNATLLALAGVYQFSALKNACVARCRHPLTFFMANWRDGHLGAFQMGLKLGVVCLGCCWALMLLAFVAGTMNLAFMGLATLLMTVEKLPDFGRVVSAPLGAALLAAAGATLAIDLVTLI